LLIYSFPSTTLHASADVSGTTSPHDATSPPYNNTEFVFVRTHPVEAMCLSPFVDIVNAWLLVSCQDFVSQFGRDQLPMLPSFYSKNAEMTRRSTDLGQYTTYWPPAMLTYKVLKLICKPSQMYLTSSLACLDATGFHGLSYRQVEGAVVGTRRC